MPMPIDDDDTHRSGGAAASVRGNLPMPIVRCNAMSWTDETEERLKVLVTRSDPVAG